MFISLWKYFLQFLRSLFALNSIYQCCTDLAAKKTLKDAHIESDGMIEVLIEKKIKERIKNAEKISKNEFENSENYKLVLT